MRQYDPNLPLFSLHIPKCGGTSLLHALRKWFWPWRLIEHYPRRGEPLPKAARVGPKMCVHGHFIAARGHGVLDVYPQANQFITFLREPFDRYLSLWHFLPKMAEDRGDTEWLKKRPDFATALKRRARRQRTGNNPESLTWHLPQRLDVADAGTQMDRSFVFVGIMERYQDSLDALAVAFNKRPWKVPHLNKTSREQDYEEWRPFYRRHFADEYAIYEAALKRNDELLRQYL